MSTKYVFARPKATRDDVINNRSHGLKAFDKAVATAGLTNIIDKAIQYHNNPQWADIWGPQACWGHFRWCFGQAWRDVHKFGGQSMFNLDEVLNDVQIAYIRQKCGIECDHMSFGWPRKNGIKFHHCQVHDDPSKYACA